MWTPQPPPAAPPPGASRRPTTVTWLWALTAVQVVAVAVGFVQAFAFTVTRASRADGQTLEGLFEGLGTLVGAACTLAALVSLVATIVFVAVLRPGPPRRQVGRLVTVGILEGVLLIPAGLLAAAAFSDPYEPEIGTVPAVFTIAAVVVIVLAIVPRTRAWARGPVPPPGPPATWPPTAPWGPPYGAP